MQEYIDKYMPTIITYCEYIVFAIVVLIIGIWIIKAIDHSLSKSKALSTVDPTIKRFTLSAIKICLYIVLFISVIGILGIPMASIITVLASAGLAVGLALQGALSNLAGGIMLMLFRPLAVGEYVSVAGVEGTVRAITLFSTTFTTGDNKVITVPNGTLMNSTVTNFSRAPHRRVDLSFATAVTEDPKKVEEVLMNVLNANSKVLKEPAPAFARMSGTTNDSKLFTVRAWVNNPDYWDVYFDLISASSKAMADAGFKGPATAVTVTRVN